MSLSNATSTLQQAGGMVAIATGSSAGDNEWVIVVDVVMLALTLIGATGILLNMAYNEFVLHRAATVRMRLVQALVVSDFLLGISALVPSVTKLRRETVHHGTPFCDGFGFVLVAAVWGEHCWTLVLAVATYMILCHPLHAVTRMLDKRWIWLYLVVWSICIAVALIGFELYGYWPAGGICYYGSNAGLYSELVQFIPRGFVFVVVIVVYSRLHSFLKRPDRIKGSFSRSRNKSQDRTGQTSSGEYEIGGIPMHGDGHGQVIRQGRECDKGKLPSRDKLMAGFRRFSFGPGGAKAEFEEEKANGQLGTEMGDIGESKRGGLRGSATPNGTHSPPESEVTQVSDRTPVTTAIPPWERIELPAFQIGDTRYGGSPATNRDSQSHFMNWKGMGKTNKPLTARGSRSGSAGTIPDTSSHPRLSTSGVATARRDRRRTNEMGSVGSIQGRPVTPNGALVGFGMRPSSRSQDSSPTLPGTGEVSILGSPTNSTTFDGRRESVDEPGSLVPAARRHPGPICLAHTNNRHSIVSPYPSPLGTTQMTNSLAYPLDTLPALSTTESVSTYHTSSIPSVADTLPLGGREIFIRRDSGLSGSDADFARRGSGPVTFALPPAKFVDLVSEKRRGSFPTSSSRRSSVDEGTLFPASQLGDKSRLNDVEAQREEPAAEDSDEEMDLARMLADSYEENHQPSFSRRRISDESEDWQQESMASYMNRKTAMLMLYFPIAYVVLFSVSLVRLIYDFSTTTKEPLALTAISRWLVFAQGLVDAAIYGGIEWKTKRAVRRKIRRGQLSPNDSRTGSRGSLAAEMFKVSAMRRYKGNTSTTQMEGDEGAVRGSSIPRVGSAHVANL